MEIFHKFNFWISYMLQSLIVWKHSWKNCLAPITFFQSINITLKINCLKNLLPQKRLTSFQIQMKCCWRKWIASSGTQMVSSLVANFLSGILHQRSIRATQLMDRSTHRVPPWRYFRISCRKLVLAPWVLFDGRKTFLYFVFCWLQSLC